MRQIVSANGELRMRIDPVPRVLTGEMPGRRNLSQDDSSLEFLGDLLFPVPHLALGGRRRRGCCRLFRTGTHIFGDQLDGSAQRRLGRFSRMRSSDRCRNRWLNRGAGDRGLRCRSRHHRGEGVSWGRSRRHHRRRAVPMLCFTGGEARGLNVPLLRASRGLLGWCVALIF